MFDFSFSELLLVIVVAVVFIQPKDLPVIMRAVTKAMRSLRAVTHEIRLTFDEISRETGLHDVKETLDAEMRMIKGDDGKMYESYDVSGMHKPAVEKNDKP